MASRKQKRGRHVLKKRKVKRIVKALPRNPRRKIVVAKKQSKSKKSSKKSVKRKPTFSSKKRSAKRGQRAPRKRKPASTTKLRAQLKKARAQLALTKKKLRQARVERRLKLLKQRAKRRREVPKMIKVLPGLDEYERRRAILDILSTADDSDEYWELVQEIADELELTTYLVASVASPPRGGTFAVAA